MYIEVHRRCNCFRDSVQLFFVCVLLVFCFEFEFLGGFVACVWDFLVLIVGGSVVQDSYTTHVKRPSTPSKRVKRRGPLQFLTTQLCVSLIFFSFYRLFFDVYSRLFLQIGNSLLSLLRACNAGLVPLLLFKQGLQLWSSQRSRGNRSRWALVINRCTRQLVRLK
jgi:hypothetical protein